MSAVLNVVEPAVTNILNQNEGGALQQQYGRGLRDRHPPDYDTGSRRHYQYYCNVIFICQKKFLGLYCNFFILY
jgi:hypothetical protein